MMFSSSLRSTLTLLVVAALSVSATPTLSLKVSGPQSVNDVGRLRVVATLVNTGDETLKLLNDPRGALSTLPTDTFTITDVSGSTPAFTGVKVKYVPQVAASSNDKKAFTVLAPGQSIAVTHNLATAYNFTRTGEGSYNFEADNLFHYIDNQNNIVPIYADAAAYTARISGRLAVVEPTLFKRARFVGCSSDQQSKLDEAAKVAQTFAAESLAFLEDKKDGSSRYTTWFGTHTSSRRDTVLGHFKKISNNTLAEYTFDCTCKDANTYAYVYPNNFGYVTLCGAFWKAPLEGTDSRAGTIIHESSHFTKNGGTDDHVYGQTKCKDLAIRNPKQAVNNADSHEYFAENNPSLS
ncbi:hypothetical protein HGRIS_008373 [Hohenbuehelia grisea]|uniref:Lysine-specific metallo-endopeptidase domain-containing protein n=1 Tax=Hohenbuehelia grisea TaxID=104357 RepID=A0ABR3J7X6_9AGAR